jgi:hypothetical protein
MIDHVMLYATEAGAKADKVRLSDALGIPATDTWQLNQSIPDIRLWQPSKDTVVNDNVVHTYLKGFFLLLSLNRVEPLLRDAPSIFFILDRDAASRGAPFVVFNDIGDMISDIAFAPAFAGSNYPLGGWPVPDSPPVV